MPAVAERPKRRQTTPEPKLTAPPPGVLLLTESQVAYLLQCGIGVVRRMTATGELPRVRMPAELRRYSRAVVERMIERGFPEPTRN